MKKLWQIVNLFRSLPAIWMYYHLPCRKEIDMDLMLHNSSSWWGLHTCMLGSALFRKIFYYRTHQHAPLLTKISKLLYPAFPTMELYAGSIGGGMTVYHGYSTIVFARSIGKNFSVYQQVTIGRGKAIDGNDVPIIGDNVTVYAGAIIVGGVRIGNNVKIGAGAVVTKDVPDNATVVGASIRIIEK